MTRRSASPRRSPWPTTRYHGLDTRIVRIFNTYGPRMRPRDGRVVSNFIVQALSSEPLTIYGDGSQTRSFCYASDEVDGIYKLFMSGDSNPTNIGNPDEYTVKQLAELVVELTGTRAPIVYEPLPKDDPKVRKPDITRARTMLGLGAEGARARRAGADHRVLQAARRHADDGAADAAAAPGGADARMSGRTPGSDGAYRDGGLAGRAVYLSQVPPEPIGLSRVPALLCYSSRRVLFAVLLLSLAACHPDFKIGTFTTNEALYRAGLAEFQRWPVGQRRFGVREAHDRPARPRHAAAALALVPRREPISEQQRVGAGRHELHAPRRELPRRHAGGRRRARSGAVLQEAVAQAAARPDVRRERRGGATTRCSACSRTRRCSSRRRRSWPTSRRCSRRRTTSRGCTTCGARRTTRRSSTSRTSSRSIPTTPSARIAQLRLVDAYKAIRYKDDAADQCAELRRSFPDDAEVSQTCSDVASAVTSSTADSTRATPPATGPPTR